MIISLLLSSPQMALIWIMVILIALTVHEFSHAYVGYKKGDMTAERMGRLTLNPVAHIDPWGFVMLLLLGFGWAKPVPFNPYNLKDPKRDSIHIALAGPASNLILAVAAGLSTRFFIQVVGFGESNLLIIFLKLLVLVNLFLLFFNIIPIPPLDGSKLVEAIPDSSPLREARDFIMKYGSVILTLLIVASIANVIDVFGFIVTPSVAICNALVGGVCF